MRRLLLALALVVVAACKGGSTPSSPSGGSTKFTTWSGPISYSQVVSLGFQVTVTWQGNLEWVLDDPTKEGLFHLKSGAVHVTYTGTAPCAYDGSQPDAQVILNPDRNSKLVVNADGLYSGEFHAETTVIVRSVCPPPIPVAFDPTFVAMDVTFFGRAVGSSIKDNMVPVVAGSTTYSGSWAFTGHL